MKGVKAMKIKEVEELVGLDRGNIYYYEKEGLLKPKRNKENNYREYSQEDVDTLNKIKLLRVLDISTADIKLLNAGESSLQDVAKKQLEEFKTIKKNIEHLQEVCNIIIDEDVALENLNEEIFSREKLLWKERLQEIAKKDIVEENIGKKELNQTICMMLTWGYFLNALVTFFLGNFLMKVHTGGIGSMTQSEDARISIENLPERYWGGVFNVEWWMIACIVISVGSWLLSNMTANVKKQVVIFHVNALILSPMLLGFIRMVEDPLMYLYNICIIQDFTGAQISLFWILMMVYVVVLYFVSMKWELLFSRFRYAFSIAVMFALTYTGIIYMLSGHWLVPGIAFFIMLSAISFHWMSANTDRDKYNRYYAVVRSQKIMNFISLVFESLRGY